MVVFLLRGVTAQGVQPSINILVASTWALFADLHCHH
jgi:hypothetical protein